MNDFELEKRVRIIQDLRTTTLSFSDIAKKHGVSYMTVFGLRFYRDW